MVKELKQALVKADADAVEVTDNEEEPEELKEDKPVKSKKKAAKIPSKPAETPPVAPMGSKKGKSASSAPKEKKTLKSSPRPIGKTTKVGVFGTWFHIFDLNEKRRDKLSDKEIGEFVQKEFPQKTSKYFIQVSRSRKEYNDGRFGTIKKRSTSLDDLIKPSVSKKLAKKQLPAKKVVTKKGKKVTLKKGK